MFSRREEGITLLETLLAVTVTMLVLTASLRLLAYASAGAARAVVRGELTECARIAADVMSTNIQRADECKITVDGNNSLNRMELTEPNRAEPYVFKYSPDAQASANSYHRLEFSGDGGSNELASNLADIRVLFDGSHTLTIEIVTDGAVTTNSEWAGIRGNIGVDPVALRIAVNVAGKKVTMNK